MAETDQTRVTLAAIAGAHGLGGEVRLKLFTEDLSRYKKLDAAGRTLTLVKLRPGSNGAVARFAEITDRTAAEAMRGTALTISRDELPPLEEGEYYHSDVIGLPCVTDAGVPIGTVVAIENFGAGDVIEIEKPDGKRFMVPMRTPAVPEWSLERLVVDAAFVE
ncbi:16S rRNA processing protein RimM [Sphingomonas vulcanisoli]|uniref:Ribosome maturation factor RimM n=1 Tax=Sphingomonas vulcanisoli TaxID=1658060 RepID=A0ABX0TZ04_9SPHN|nr:ribosome maturation factor RimM [Sphingomonas vulcanisoli]NIJ09600.1 16S rRNA processing protein RimM [Sphingomonas vulcanisoli]